MEDSYSYWALYMREFIISKYNELKQNKSNLSLFDINLLAKYHNLIKLSKFQGKLNNNTLTNDELEEYLKLKNKFGLEDLRNIKLTEEELIKAEDLINSKTIFDIEGSGPVFRYAKEILEENEINTLKKVRGNNKNIF